MYFIETGESELDLPDQITANSNKTITKDGVPTKLNVDSTKNIEASSVQQSQISNSVKHQNNIYSNLNNTGYSISNVNYGVQNHNTYSTQSDLNNYFY